MASNGPPRSARLAVLRIAAEQHGVFRLDQAVAAGMSADAVYRRVRLGEWSRIFERVFCLDPAGGGWLSRVSAACLWAGDGSAASYRCAAALWELDGVNAGHVEISYPGRKRSPRGLLVHETNRPFTIHRRSGIPVTSVPRTLLDLGSVVPFDRVEFALEDALRRRLTTMQRIQETLEHEGGKGRGGAGVLRELIETRGMDTPATASWLETRLAIVTRRAGLAPPVRQHRVRRADGRDAFIDFSYPERKVAIEVDSYRWHSGRTAWEKDRVRSNELVALGWRVVHVTSGELAGDAAMFVATLRRLLGEEPLFDASSLSELR